MEKVSLCLVGRREKGPIFMCLLRLIIIAFKPGVKGSMGRGPMCARMLLCVHRVYHLGMSDALHDWIPAFQGKTLLLVWASGGEGVVGRWITVEKIRESACIMPLKIPKQIFPLIYCCYDMKIDDCNTHFLPSSHTTKNCSWLAHPPMSLLIWGWKKSCWLAVCANPSFWLVNRMIQKLTNTLP